MISSSDILPFLGLCFSAALDATSPSGETGAGMGSITDRVFACKRQIPLGFFSRNLELTGKML